MVRVPYMLLTTFIHNLNSVWIVIAITIILWGIIKLLLMMVGTLIYFIKMSLSSLILRLIQCGLLTVHTKDSRMSQLLASLISWRPKHHFLELTFSCLTSSFAIKEKSTIFSTFSLNSVVFPPCSPPFSWFLANSWTITSYMPNRLEHSTWMGRAAVLILEWDLTTWTYLLK